MVDAKYLTYMKLCEQHAIGGQPVLVLFKFPVIKRTRKTSLWTYEVGTTQAPFIVGSRSLLGCSGQIWMHGMRMLRL